MRIRSSLNDYYDWVSGKYGEDPDIVYLRKRLPKAFSIKAKDLSGDFVWHWYEGRTHFEYIIAGMKVFVMLTRDPEKVGDKPTHPTVAELRAEVKPEWLKYWEWARKFMSPNFGVSDTTLVELIRLVGAPVFRISSSNHGHVLIVHDAIPILQDYGIAKEVPAEEMWKNIYYTLQNVLRTNPDKLPPVLVGNDDMIVEKGFDLKTSFRGRDPKTRKARHARCK
jgi:hypothetical protein